MINPSKLEPSVSSDVIRVASWIKHYSSIFSVINYDVHSGYSYLLSDLVPLKHIIPVSCEQLLKSIIQLKLKYVDHGGIAVQNLLIMVVLLSPAFKRSHEI